MGTVNDGITHSEKCWKWHHGCAEKKITEQATESERLNTAMKEIVDLNHCKYENQKAEIERLEKLAAARLEQCHKLEEIEATYSATAKKLNKAQQRIDELEERLRVQRAGDLIVEAAKVIGESCKT